MRRCVVKTFFKTIGGMNKMKMKTIGMLLVCVSVFLFSSSAFAAAQTTVKPGVKATEKNISCKTTKDCTASWGLISKCVNGQCVDGCSKRPKGGCSLGFTCVDDLCQIAQ